MTRVTLRMRKFGMVLSKFKTVFYDCISCLWFAFSWGRCPRSRDVGIHEVYVLSFLDIVQSDF